VTAVRSACSTRSRKVLRSTLVNGSTDTGHSSRLPRHYLSTLASPVVE
jgi:hypothetical protein